MVKYYFKNGTGKTINEIPEFKKGAWIYAEDPTRNELADLVERFDLEEGHLTDALDIHEVPRFEIEGNTLYAYLRFVYSEKSDIETAPILFIINEKVFITLSKEPLPFLKKFTTQEVQFSTKNSAETLFNLIFNINQTYTTMLNNISRQVRSLSVRIENIANKDIVAFVHLESILNEFMSNLVPNNVVLNHLLANRSIKIFDENHKDLVEDLLLSNNQLIEITRSNLRTIVNIREASSTIITNNLNRIIKLFTSLTVVLTIPTIVASIFGMNVQLPFDQHPYAFWGIIGVILTISLGLFYLFNKKEWL